MLKNITTLFALTFILISCETTAPITNSMTYEELELDASTMSTKLDINIVELDPGLSGSNEDANLSH